MKEEDKFDVLVPLWTSTLRFLLVFIETVKKYKCIIMLSWLALQNVASLWQYSSYQQTHLLNVHSGSEEYKFKFQGQNIPKLPLDELISLEKSQDCWHCTEPPKVWLVSHEVQRCTNNSRCLGFNMFECIADCSHSAWSGCLISSLVSGVAVSLCL